LRTYALVGFAMLAACKAGDSAAPDTAASGDKAAPSNAVAGGDKASPGADAPPVSASFMDLGEGESARSVPVGPCTELLVTPVRGTVRAEDLPLATGDIAAIRGPRRITVKGAGTVLVAWARLTACDVPRMGTVVKSGAASDLAFMHGTMHARLDLDDRNLAPTFYFGRLSGTAAVPEHAHAGTWELLCAVDAAGTFTLAGAPSRLGARMCVTVPPDTKHSWQPDPGSTLTALQMYWPPGPEQRFKKLAADELAGEGRDH
jgi:mannose-6-phosphate isomerase-like protein (cupin superfamily)